MKFTPRSEADLQRDNLCPPGIYPFSVMAAKDETSRTGKQMISLKLNVHGDEGRSYHVYDYISPDFMPFKLRHFAVAVGLEKQYESGGMDAHHCLERQGWCDVAVKEDREYGPKNVIKDYTKGKNLDEVMEQPPAVGVKAEAANVEDDVPF
jgi:hypothetical protein